MAKELNIEDIIDLIVEGDTYRSIANQYNISLYKLQMFLLEPIHSARAREALQLSADSYADMAEQVLIEAPKDAIEMQRARELAQHYRWKAKCREPKKYGDKTDITSNGESITSFAVGFKKEEGIN